MQILLNKYLDNKYLINLLIGIIPISFIAGNLNNKSKYYYINRIGFFIISKKIF